MDNEYLHARITLEAIASIVDCSPIMNADNPQSDIKDMWEQLSATIEQFQDRLDTLKD